MLSLRSDEELIEKEEIGVVEEPVQFKSGLDLGLGLKALEVMYLYKDFEGLEQKLAEVWNDDKALDDYLCTVKDSAELSDIFTKVYNKLDEIPFKVRKGKRSNLRLFAYTIFICYDVDNDYKICALNPNNKNCLLFNNRNKCRRLFSTKLISPFNALQLLLDKENIDKVVLDNIDSLINNAIIKRKFIDSLNYKFFNKGKDGSKFKYYADISSSGSCYTCKYFYAYTSEVGISGVSKCTIQKKRDYLLKLKLDLLSKLKDTFNKRKHTGASASKDTVFKWLSIVAEFEYFLDEAEQEYPDCWIRLTKEGNNTLQSLRAFAFHKVKTV
jgi:hypothetical protein